MSSFKCSPLIHFLSTPSNNSDILSLIFLFPLFHFSLLRQVVYECSGSAAGPEKRYINTLFLCAGKVVVRNRKWTYFGQWAESVWIFVPLHHSRRLLSTRGLRQSSAPSAFWVITIKTGIPLFFQSLDRFVQN